MVPLQRASVLGKARCSRTGLSSRPQTLIRLQNRSCIARASGGDSEVNMPAAMSVEEAYSVLQLPASSSPGFEEIMTAKNKLMAANEGDQEMLMQIEAAYDTLFMQSMKRRISGEVVSTSVKYADVPTPKKKGTQRAGAGQTTLLQRLPGGGVSLEAPRGQNAALVQAAVMGGLAAWSLTQALLESPDAQAADTAGLQLALAAAFAVYSYKENKKLPFGRSLGLMASTCAAGILVGALLNQWLRVDIVPVGAFGSPGVLVTEFAIAAMWAGVAFLA